MYLQHIIWHTQEAVTFASLSVVNYHYYYSFFFVVHTWKTAFKSGSPTGWLVGWLVGKTTTRRSTWWMVMKINSPPAARSRTLAYNSSSHNSTADDDEIGWPSSARNKKLSTLCTQRRNGYLGHTGCRSHHGKVRTHRRIHSEYPMAIPWYLSTWAAPDLMSSGRLKINR